MLKLSSLPVFTGLVAVTIVGAGYFAKHTHQQQTVARNPAGVVGKETATVSLKKGELHFAEQTERAYRFSRQLKATVASQTLLDLEFSGELTIATLEQEGTALKQVATLTFDKKTLDQFSPDMRTAAAKEKPAVSFLRNDQGHITDLKAIPEPSGSTRFFDEKKRILIDLVAQYAFFSTDDSLGHYTAQIDELGPRHYQKRKLAYLASSDSPVVSKVLTSRHDLLLDAEGIQTVEGSETIESGNDSMRMVQWSSYRIEAGNSKPISTQSQDLAQTIHQKSEAVTFSRPSNQKITAAETLTRKTWTWTQLLPNLKNVASLKASERMRTFHELIRTLKKNPALVREVELLVRANPKDTALFKLGVGALASSGGIEAERSLRKIYQDKITEPDSQRMILTAFTSTDAPITTETQEFLKTIVREPDPAPGFSESAAFALGSSLKKEEDATQRVSLQTTLTDLLTQSKTNYEKGTYIDAIGNSGDADLLPAVREYLLSDNTTLREKAVFSLRWMPVASVGSEVTKAMDDPLASVRRSAVQTIRYQKDAGQSIDGYQDKLSQCAKKESSPEIRAQCSRIQASLES